MNVGSLFSGIGGIDLGLERAGHRVAWQCERDEWRRLVLSKRFPGLQLWEDITHLEAYIKHRPLVRVESEARGAGDGCSSEPDGTRRTNPDSLSVDLLCGGFPCQDLSVAGRRAGLAGERSSLFFDFARVADELVQPGGYVLIENVPGLLSSNGGRDFAVVLATLAELGFHDLAWRVLDSRHFGVPQRRRRVFILGRRSRGDRCAQVLLEPESCGGHFAESGEAGSEPSVASLSGLGSGGPDDNDGQGGRLVAGPLDTRQTPNGHGMAGVNDQQAFNNHIVADTLTSGSHLGSNMPGRRREDDTNLVPTAFQMPQDPISEEDSTPVWGKGNKTGTASLAIQQGPAVRRLTPRECERLQGFPDDWTALGPDSRRYAALGDAVTVPVAEWIGERLAA